MTEWREVTIEELAEKIAMGPFGSDIKVETFKPCGVPIISGKHLHETRMRDKGFNFISEEHADKLSNANVFRGDVIFTHAGNIGQVSFIPENSKYERYVISQRQFYLRCNSNVLDYEFIAYYFKSPYGQYQLLANANQTGVPSLAQPVSYLKSIKVLLPSLTEQKAIAEVLSSLDDKIDLLTRQNKTLEDLAQAYFRKWFIEDASDEWEVGKLGDEFNITMGQSPKGETYNDLKIGLPFFQGKAEFGFRFPLEKQYCSEPIKIADKFDTLLSVRAPVGALNMAMYRCCIGRGLAVPIHKKGYKHYTFYKMKSLQEVFDTFDDDGTVFGSISREKFLSIDNVIPPEKLVCSFDNFARHIDLKIYENTIQIRTLAKLRDTLLPKLINGEIRVKM